MGPILTHGAAKAGAISYNNPMVYPELQDFFMPTDSVAVFDHTVTGPVLDSVECFIVCGHALGAETFAALERRVSDGAVCIIARRLYRRHRPGGDADARWHVIESFADGALAELLAPFLGPPDVARFRFATGTIEFRRGPKANSVTVHH